MAFNRGSGQREDFINILLIIGCELDVMKKSLAAYEIHALN